MTLIYQIEATEEEAKKIMKTMSELMDVLPEAISKQPLPHKILLDTIVENNVKIKNQTIETTHYPHLKIVRKAV